MQGLIVVYSSALNIYIILFIPYVGLFLLSFSVCEAHKKCAAESLSVYENHVIEKEFY